MIGERHAEITNRIGNMLLDILPEHAEQISIRSTVGDDWSKSEVDFKDEAGTEGEFEFEDAPKRAIGDLHRALMDLRQEYTEGGGEAWNRVVFTAHRDGKFDVEFSYEDDKFA